MVKPTNTDIFRKLTDVEKNQGSMLKMIEDHEARIRPLENWKIAYEAAVKALEGMPGRKVTDLNDEFIKIIFKFLTVVTTLLGIIYLLIKQLTGP